MFIVKFLNRIKIFKSQLSFRKTNAVLSQIFFRFDDVPFKNQILFNLESLASLCCHNANRLAYLKAENIRAEGLI